MTRFDAAKWTLGLLAGAVAHGVVGAAWTPVDPGPGAGDPSVSIDLDTVRQAGPMAIYRQVAELTVYAARQTSGLQSILRLAEYDCMSARVRVLRETGFASPAGAGAQVPLPAANQRLGEWVALGTHPAGEAVWKRVCPGRGED